jgi:hypothetical protein
MAGKERFAEFLPFYKQELDLVSHRPYTDSIFNEFNKGGFTPVPYINRAMFLGYNTMNGPQEDYAVIKTYNPIYRNEVIEAIFPIKDSINDDRYTVKEILDMNNTGVEMARPGFSYRIKFDKSLGDNAILRKRLL